jgi:carnosine N-methyltransferase
MLAAPPFNYLETLDKTDDAIESNAELARAIARFGLESFGQQSADPSKAPTMPREWDGVAKHSDIDKARSTLRQFYRDWSEAGAAEREISYGPIMRAIDHERARLGDGSGSLKILVPGAGLARLVFDLFCKGYNVEGNEISYHQLLASSYILNGVGSANRHTIYPWIHTFSNHRIRSNHLRGYTVPDIHPAGALERINGIGSMAMCAADFLCLYGDEAHKDKYDAVACVFFLDTAPNLIRYLDVILHCLKPGGILVNVGPLLWHFENHAPGNHGCDDDGDGEHDYSNSSGIADPGSFELSDDEVMALVEKMGFVVESRQTGIEAPYILDSDSMLQTSYRASSWVARKPVSLTGPNWNNYLAKSEIAS